MVKLAKVGCLLAVLVMAFATMALAQATYAEIEVPGAVQSQLLGINSAGDVVGFYLDNANLYHGFLLSDGIFTTLDVPGAAYTEAAGINDVGQIVGVTDTNGFLYDIATGVFTTLEYPRSGTIVYPFQINNAGTIVGDIQLGDRSLGFELNGTTYTPLKVAGFESTVVTSINNLGDALLYGYNRSGSFSHYILSQGKLKKLNVSDAVAPDHINDSDAIVGSVSRGKRGTVGYVKQGKSEQILRFPGQKETFGQGINNSGMVVGTFVSERVFHSYIWTPPADAAKK